MEHLVLGIDQSTQGTKALLIDSQGNLVAKSTLAHKQIINELGYVEHDLNEIAHNVIAVVRELVSQDPSYKERIAAVGLSVQRETVGAWSKSTGKPLYNAIVWQCGRGAAFVAQPSVQEQTAYIREVTGLELSEFFSAPKMAWLMDNVDSVKEAATKQDLCLGNIDSFLIYLLTKGAKFATEPSNASRTMLMDLSSASWDAKLCELFHVPNHALAAIEDSNTCFGYTDFEGVLPKAVPIHAALGDSQAALFGQGCFDQGQTKTTYGTGSSIMMNAGTRKLECSHGIVCSAGWRRKNEPMVYVLEGNINYSAGVISYLKDDLGLISSPAETESLAREANPQDKCYFVPAFSGLGAPHFESNARGTIVGMSRLTTRKELVRAALDSIAYQVSDVVELIRTSAKAAKVEMTQLNVDGGATMNGYLMQLQSDLIKLPLAVPKYAELSGMGAASMAGIACDIIQEEVLRKASKQAYYQPAMSEELRQEKLAGWHKAVKSAIAHGI